MLPSSREHDPARQGFERLRAEFARAAEHFRPCSFTVFASYFPKSPSEWESFLTEYQAVQDDHSMPAPDEPSAKYGLPIQTPPPRPWERRLPLSGGNWLARCGGPEPSKAVFAGLAVEGVRLAASLRGAISDARPTDSEPEAAWLNLVWAVASAFPAHFDIDRYSFREWVDYFHSPPVTRKVIDYAEYNTTFNVLISDFREGLFALSAAVIDLWLSPMSPPHEGAPAAHQSVPQAGAAAGSAVPALAHPQKPKPVWNDEDGELIWMGVTIRKYKSQSAPTQIKILAAFQKAGWPTSILNPFVDKPPEGKARAAHQKNLRSRIDELNAGLKKGTIEFHPARGDRVAWRLATKAKSGE